MLRNMTTRAYKSRILIPSDLQPDYDYSLASLIHNIHMEPFKVKGFPFNRIITEINKHSESFAPATTTHHLYWRWDSKQRGTRVRWLACVILDPMMFTRKKARPLQPPTNLCGGTCFPIFVCLPLINKILFLSVPVHLWCVPIHNPLLPFISPSSATYSSSSSSSVGLSRPFPPPPSAPGSISCTQLRRH